MNINDIAVQIRGGELEQCILELKSDGLMGMTISFLEDMLQVDYRLTEEVLGDGRALERARRGRV